LCMAREGSYLLKLPRALRSSCSRAAGGLLGRGRLGRGPLSDQYRQNPSMLCHADMKEVEVCPVVAHRVFVGGR
jgi:hypothetical protein